MQDSDSTTAPVDPSDTQDNQQTPEQSEIEQLKAELEQERNAKLLTKADFENYRKNIDKEKAKFGAMANMQLVTQILEVIDDIQLALQDESLTKERAEEMLAICQDKLTVAISIAGLEKVEVKVGDTYNSSMMEAITTAPVDSEDKNNTVVAVISSGYQYSGEGSVLKTAKVVVGKHTPKAE